jgi:NhaP-type Na+/H+ or K+/H+ antiporter
MEQWIVEGWLYIIVMSVVIGVIIGYGSMYAIKFGLRRRWIDNESFMLWPMAIGVRVHMEHLGSAQLTYLPSSLLSEYVVFSAQMIS